MTDSELRQRVLQKYYDLRKDGKIRLQGEDFGDEIPDSEVTRISKSLYDDGLIDYSWSRDAGGEMVTYHGEISSPGVRLIEQGGAGISAGGQVTVYNLHGSNSRVNIGSSDASVNIVSVDADQLFADLRTAIQELDTASRTELMSAVEQMETSAGKDSFAQRYSEFMALAASHATVFKPFLPALTQLLST